MDDLDRFLDAWFPQREVPAQARPQPPVDPWWKRGEDCPH